jgi:hypothetical protein
MNNLSITIDIKQLSEEIHLAVKTIRSTLVNNPTALPPRLIICGQKKLLWLREDVIKYYSTQKKSHGSNPEFASQRAGIFAKNEIEKMSRKRGRPTKAAQIEKSMAGK